MQVNSDFELCPTANGKHTAGLTDLWYLPAFTHFWSQAHGLKLSFCVCDYWQALLFVLFANIQKGETICFPN